MSVQVNLPARTAATDLTGPTGPQGDKGDPGGNAMAIGLFTDAATLTIPVGTDLVQTSGHATVGYGRAHYAYDVAVDAAYVTANPYTAFRDVAGRGFRLSEERPTNHMFGVRGDGLTDYATRLTSWLTYCATYGKRGVWCYDSAAYRTGTLSFPSNTHIEIQPNTTIEAAVGAVRIFQFSATSNCSVIAGRGVTINGRSVATSGLVYMVGASNIWLEGLYVTNSASNKDCFYVGNSDGTTTGYCSNITMVNCVGDQAGRNGISVVACVDFLAEKCTFQNTKTASTPGAGVDVEANSFNDILRRITFRKCVFTGNYKHGALNNFGSDVLFEDCDSYNNGYYGIAVSAGGNQTDTTKSRTNVDIFAITAADMTTGKLTLSGGTGVRSGMTVQLFVRSGGVLPGGLVNGTRYMIYSKEADGVSITLYNSNGTSQVATFSDNGSGTLTSDPLTSAMYLYLVNDEWADRTRIKNCRVSGNCTAGSTVAEVSVAVASNTIIEECDITATAAGIYGIVVTYSRGVKILNNNIRSTVDSSGVAKGISLGNSFNVVESGNSVVGFAGNALSVNGCPKSRWGDKSSYSNCGTQASPTALVSCTSQIGGMMSNATLRSDKDKATTYGLDANGWTNGTIDGCDFTATGSSNATSLRSTDTSMVIGRNILWDGTTYAGRTGSKTYDAPSVASGGNFSTTLTVTGAKAGDASWASMPTLSGMSCTATCLADNTLTITGLNSTGGAVDLASQLLTGGALRNYA
jgi:hypothetical protein